MTRKLRLGEVINIKHGFAFPGEAFGENPRDPILVTPGNFALGGGFRAAKPKTFSGSIPAGFILEPGSLIITMTDLSKAGDTLGLPAIVPGDGVYLHNQRIGLVEAISPTAVSLRFLAYYLRTNAYRSYVLSTASGSTVRHTSPRRIAAFEAVLPELAEQRAIAEVLGALDDKIAANVKVVECSEELSRTLFGSLLRDGDLTPLIETARFINGRAFTKDATGTGRVVIRIAELNSGIGGSTVRNDVLVHEDHLARPGDLLFAWSGSLTLHRWYRDEGIINQHIFKVVPKNGYPLWLVNQLLVRKLAEFRAIAADKATTMGHIQRRHLEEPVLMPSEAEIRRHNERMTALWDIALSAERESLMLAELRDTLLPHLMSGRLRVKDAEKTVEAVV